MADKIVDLADARDRKHGPDKQFLCRDERGVKWFLFACKFKDGDDEFGFNVLALDMPEAERRLKLIRENATLEGQLFSEIPA